jgi:hypothetical protein
MASSGLAEDPSSAPAASSLRADQCVRCGKTFRGHWDRHSTPQGTLCHICHNQVRPAGESTSSGYIAPVESIKIETEEPFIPPPPSTQRAEEERGLGRYVPSNETMRKVASVGAVIVILLALFMALTSGFEVPETGIETPAVAAEAPAPVSPLVYWLAVIITWGVNYAAAFAGLYLFLAWVNHLPSDRTWANLVVLIPVSILLTLFYLVPFYLGYMLAGALIFWLYDCTPLDMIRLPVVWFAAFILKYSLGGMLLGLLGAAAT